MKYCHSHWEALRAAITERDLWPLVSTDTVKCMQRIARFAEFGRGEDFDPLLTASIDIGALAVTEGLLSGQAQGCPLCAAEKAEYGLASQWIDQAANDQRETARRLGLFKQQS